MYTLINAAFSRNRTVMLLLIFIFISGSYAYLDIPKESEPDIAIPFIYVSMTHDGISPEDAERLLVKPMEKELQSIEGIKEMKSVASEGHASVILEFEAGFDSKQALQDVRERVDIAKTELPSDTDEPSVNEVNFALFPVLNIGLAGDLSQRTLLRLARDLKDRIEALENVLEVNISGDREEVVEVLTDPMVMDTYQINHTEVFDLIGNNNRLVAAGALDTGAGRMVMKVPGVIETLKDMLAMPVKVGSDNTVITIKDVATVRRTFKDAESFARINGQPAVVLEVTKRVGENIIETIEAVRAVVTAEQQHWPASVEITYSQDKSNDIRNMLSDLQNNILSAIVLVMIVIVAALGLRSSLLVGLAIPGSFLAGIFIIYIMGYTVNIVVLFSLILVVGMLVDGAIVVTELADRHINDGMAPPQAFANASKRMAMPVFASTLTTLAVFFPLMFWPGLVGEFMKYLPITVSICLFASLFMALIFIPVLGGFISRPVSARATATATTTQHHNEYSGIAGAYLWLLGGLLRHPSLTLVAALIVLVGSYAAYAQFGRGMEFFPDVEPQFAQIQIHARGDLSIQEKDQIVQQVEQRVLGSPEIRVVYASAFNSSGNNQMAEDVIGTIQLEFVDWSVRRPASVILEELRQRTVDIAGIIVEFRKAEGGPSAGKPIQMQLSSRKPELLAAATEQIRQVMDKVGGFTDVEDNRPLPGIEWRLSVDRKQAARYGANITLLGNTIQMITSGITVTTFRPDDTNEELDIRLRFPFDERNLDQLNWLHVATSKGMVPITNFVALTPAPKTGSLQRVDSQRVITVQADVVEGLLVADKLKELRAALAEIELDPSVRITFKGEDEDQREAAEFLTQAFIIAIFLMTLILVTQFNSLYQAFLVLSAIVFSTAGVLLGLLITFQPFGIVMVGIGIIALAGIVVNNNIVLIDTYNRLKQDEGLDYINAALQTGALRLRPVFLTAFTTVLGLMPMVLAMNVDLINRTINFGAPSTQWWTQLSSAIAGGLSFATLLTLILTPCLLVLGDQIAASRQRKTITKQAETTSAA